MGQFKVVKLVNGMFPQEVDTVNDTVLIPGATLPTTGTIQGVSAVATSATTGAITINMTNGISVYTITPTGACTFNASGGLSGARMTFSITTSGTTAFVLTWGTNFKTVGTLSTGTTSGKMFSVNVICTNGTQWVETGRTAAM